MGKKQKDKPKIDKVSENDNVVKKPKKSSRDAPIVAIGVAMLCGVTFLTYTATTLVVNKLNENADLAYRMAYNNIQMSHVKAADVPSEKTILVDGKPVIADYTSDDLVEIDGKWYISSEVIEGSTDDMFDWNDTILVDGVEFVRITAPEKLGLTADNPEIPFYGNEWVVVDIDGNMVYLVRKGDTLSEVSGRIGYSVQELAAFNGIKNVNLIYSGQSLRVPASDKAIEYVKSHSNSANVNSDTNTDSNTNPNTDVTNTTNAVDTSNVSDVSSNAISSDASISVAPASTSSSVPEVSVPETPTVIGIGP